MSPTRAVLIAGPTASGKSALALAVAEAVGRAVIVNADSMQVYADLEVLTARPTAAEEATTPHRLFGTIDGAQAYSVARYVDDVAQVLAWARERGLMPIIVGGTGLYFKALLEGLSPVPAIEPEVRARLRQQAVEVGAAHMHMILSQKDPVMAARLVPTDTQRIIRALEVVEATGRSLADWQLQPGTPVLEPDTTSCFVLSIEREYLMRRCDTRFGLMLQAGALGEVAELVARGLSCELPVMRALGVRPLADHLAGKLSLEVAAEQAMTETRQFAKRQHTWLKRHMIAWKSISAQEIESNRAEIISNIDF